jgi:hypothetical protein
MKYINQPGYNEQIWSVLSSSLYPSLTVIFFLLLAELVRLQQSNSSEAEAARREQERAEIKAEVESRIGAELEQVRQELRQSKQVLISSTFYEQLLPQ